MATVTFEQVLKLAQQLSQAERARLIERLSSLTPTFSTERGRLMLEAIKAEHQRRLKAGLFETAESLYGKYASPSGDKLTPEELDAYLHEVGTEWEEEMDELGD